MNNMTESEIKILFGQNVKYLRNKKRLSQIQLAEKADVTFNFINDIENGKKWVSPVTLSKLSVALGAPLYQFFIPVQATGSDDATNEKLTMFSTDILNQIDEILKTTVKRYS